MIFRYIVNQYLLLLLCCLTKECRDNRVKPKAKKKPINTKDMSSLRVIAGIIPITPPLKLIIIRVFFFNVNSIAGNCLLKVSFMHRLCY